jgi:hypothetical protein
LSRKYELLPSLDLNCITSFPAIMAEEQKDASGWPLTWSESHSLATGDIIHMICFSPNKHSIGFTMVEINHTGMSGLVA